LAPSAIFGRRGADARRLPRHPDLDGRVKVFVAFRDDFEVHRTVADDGDVRLDDFDFERRGFGDGDGEFLDVAVPEHDAVVAEDEFYLLVQPARERVIFSVPAAIDAEQGAGEGRVRRGGHDNGPTAPALRYRIADDFDALRDIGVFDGDVVAAAEVVAAGGDFDERAVALRDGDGDLLVTVDAHDEARLDGRDFDAIGVCRAAAAQVIVDAQGVCAVLRQGHAHGAVRTALIVV
jgi:hypothetical protein